MRNKLLTIMVLGAVLMLGSCDRRKVYSHYEHIESAEWEKTDTVRFNIPRIKVPGSYLGAVGLRIENSFPYQKLTLEVNTEIQPGGRLFRHSLDCELVDKQGTVKGSGISQYQYTFPVDVFQLQEGDSIYVTVIHNMTREIMPNICDVGFTITQE